MRHYAIFEDLIRASLEQQCTCTAVLAGAGLIGIGFVQQIHALNPDIADLLEVVCFDAISFIPVFTPSMAAIDPNLHLVAYRAINILEAQLKGSSPIAHEKIKPKLINTEPNGDQSYSEFIATCVDLPEFHNANYIKTIIANMHEWVDEIVDSNLDKILSIEPTFKKFISACILSKYQSDDTGKQAIKLVKVIHPQGIINLDKTDTTSIVPISTFGKDILNKYIQENYDLACYFNVSVLGKKWGLISVFGSTRQNTPASSFFAFTAYLDAIANGYANKLLQQLANGLINRDRNNYQDTKQEEAIIQYDPTESITTWSNEALAVLGFHSKIEINIYQHMEITDRVNPNQEGDLVSQIYKLLEGGPPFQIEVDMKKKGGDYVGVTLTGKLVTHPDNNTTLEYGILLINSE